MMVLKGREGGIYACESGERKKMGLLTIHLFKAVKCRKKASNEGKQRHLDQIMEIAIHIAHKGGVLMHQIMARPRRSI